ncbi:unnamed protein product [Aureobasidium mustum]|uniref:Uncharacterized protein n=1 Tax=Aureobasidium mustum TaxID=2773714 RepID=A0A9N8KB14_9PEZI|nr:unnamed protein product [Aureobasidium mustum]
MSSITSPLPPPVTTRRRARNAAQAGNPRLKYPVVPPILEFTEPHAVEVKEELRARFDNLCEEAGWAPTAAIRDELRILTKLDAKWKQRDCEAAFFAFVQHLDFVWMNGYVLLGRKKFKEGILCVWYRPIYSPTDRRIEFCYGPGKTVFKPEGLPGRVDKDKVWPPFNKLFDLTNLRRDKQNLYLTGVWEILHKFKHMRGILDPNGSEDDVSRPGYSELPFLPGSTWLRQRGVLWIDNSPKSQNTGMELRSRLESQSPDESNMEKPDDEESDQRANTTLSAGMTSSIDEPHSCSSSVSTGTDPTGSVSASSSSSIVHDRVCGQKRKPTDNPNNSPIRKQVRASNDESETDSSLVTTKSPAQILYQDHCQRFQWTPCEPTLQELAGLLSSHDIELGDVEVALLAFAQYFDFIWENDSMFIGSRKAKGCQKYERIWYKAVYRDGELGIEWSVDAGKQPCSPPVGQMEIEYFWPSFNELFDMKNLGSAMYNQQNVYIAGTYLILLRYPALRRYQEPGSGLGIKLAPHSEKLELPFLPASDPVDEVQQLRTRQLSSFSEPLLTSVARPALSDQGRRSEAGAQTLTEMLDGRDTQRKITTMCRSTGGIYIAEPGSKEYQSILADLRNDQLSEALASTPSELVQQPQDQSPISGLVNHLLQNIQLSSFVDTTSNETKLRIVAHLPANLFQPPALGFSLVVWLDMSPVLPSRDCIIQELERIAMDSFNSQQRAAQQQNLVPAQMHHAAVLAAPVAQMVRQQTNVSSDNNVTVEQARELLRGPRAKLVSSGKDKDEGLELFQFAITFPSAVAERLPLDLKFTPILSKETVPVNLTKSQAFRALAEYAREDEES